MRRHQLIAALLSWLVWSGCAEPPRELQPALQLDALAEVDYELWVCRARLAQLEADPALSAVPVDALRRAELLGRVRGEPAVFIRAPEADNLPASLESLGGEESGSALARVARWRRRLRGRPADLRQFVLREGYLYSDDPLMAHALVRTIELPDLFDEPRIWLMRGSRRMPLVRAKRRFGSGYEYRHAAGDGEGSVARLLWADRVAIRESDLATPLHRDVRDLRDRVGFDRIELDRAQQGAMSATLSFGSLRVRGLLESHSASLSLTCLDAPASTREQISASLERQATRRRALTKLKAAIEEAVREELPFDRPRGAEDHLSDGQLRPLWNHAYRQGRTSFSHDEQGYPVFDAKGRPSPPQMCVEMIVDSYERASGSWFRPAGQTRERTAGGLDFADLGLGNRAGVLAFETFAKEHEELFVTRRVALSERIAFSERTRFFRYWLDHAEDFQVGDIIAIQGPKPDGYVHQHAILIADVDPLTGFPYALADQMRRPRIRTFEDIMAEAPKRSLLYHLRPRHALLGKMLSGEAASVDGAIASRP